MSKPSIFAFLEASEIAYGEAETSCGIEKVSCLLLIYPRTVSSLADARNFALAEGRPGWKPIAVDYSPDDGFYGVAFETPANQVIIAFEGTVRGTSQFDFNTFAADYAILSVKVPNALTDAVFFANEAMTNAEKFGVSSSNIFTTDIH